MERPYISRNAVHRKVVSMSFDKKRDLIPSADSQRDSENVYYSTRTSSFKWQKPIKEYAVLAFSPPPSYQQQRRRDYDDLISTLHTIVDNYPTCNTESLKTPS